MFMQLQIEIQYYNINILFWSLCKIERLAILVKYISSFLTCILKRTQIDTISVLAKKKVIQLIQDRKILVF